MASPMSNRVKVSIDRYYVLSSFVKLMVMEVSRVSFSYFMYDKTSLPKCHEL